MKHVGLLILILISGSVYCAEAPLPDYDKHQAFLIQPWDPGKPSLMAFKDPRCPYCIKALMNQDRLDNYNVFLFWAPILGPGSQNQVARFFHCQRPADETVISAVVARKYPLCAGDQNQALREINDQMVAAYKPNSVPQYWYGGRRVALSQLNLALPKAERLQLVAQNSPLKIQWQRYSAHAVTPPVKDMLTVGLVLPGNTRLPDTALAIMRQDNEINWYVFPQRKQRSSQNSEFRMLTNLESVSKPTWVVEGKILSDKERTSLIDKQLQRIISSS